MNINNIPKVELWNRANCKISESEYQPGVGFKKEREQVAIESRITIIAIYFIHCLLKKYPIVVKRVVDKKRLSKNGFTPVKK